VLRLSYLLGERRLDLGYRNALAGFQESPLDMWIIITIITTCKPKLEAEYLLNRRDLSRSWSTSD